MKLNGEKWFDNLKTWMKKAGDYTVEETKVLTIRAKEAGRLTALSARKHKLNSEYQDICAQLGQQLVSSSKTGKIGPSGLAPLMNEPKVKELISKAELLEKELKQIEGNVEAFKKECNDEVTKIHYKKAA